MRVVFLTGRSWPAIGGAELQTHALAEHLARRHEVKVVTLFSDGTVTDPLLSEQAETESLLQGGVRVTPVAIPLAWRRRLRPFRRLLNRGTRGANVAHYALLRALLGRRLCAALRGADVGHLVLIGPRPWSRLASDALVREGIPYVLTPYMHPSSDYSGRLLRPVVGRAGAAVAMTDAEKQRLEHAGLPPAKVHVIPAGPVVAEAADPGRFRRRYGIEAPFVLFLGRKVAYKGYRELATAARAVWRELPDVAFIFAGPETEASRGFFAAQRDDRLVSLAALGLQDKTDALAACEAVCVPSLEESLGGVYLEAWTQAKPVIACPIPAVMQVVEDGCDGFLSPQEPEPLARALLACLNGEGQRLGEAGRRKVAQRYSWERAAAQVETLYRQLVVGVSGTPER